MGKQIAEYYQDLAYKELTNPSTKRAELIAELKRDGREKEIPAELKKLTPPRVDRNLAYLEGMSRLAYLLDMQIAQEYAQLNRQTIVNEIMRAAKLYSAGEVIECTHNYIEGMNRVGDLILRKGAIRANRDDTVLIPLNMRDGVLIGVGRGNSEWNCSAPHGAGRLMSRSAAKQVVTMEEFHDSMKGIFTTSVNEGTRDESPMAYKPIEEIIGNIGDTVLGVCVLKPIYNVKAGE